MLSKLTSFPILQRIHIFDTTELIKYLVLTSSQVIVMLARFPRAKAGTLGCGGVQDPRRVEHDHLLQLGVVIHGGVREAQVV